MIWEEMASQNSDVLAGEIWNWCFNRNLFLTAQYIAGKENITADTLSRQFNDIFEWKLKPENNLFSIVYSERRSACL